MADDQYNQTVSPNIGSEVAFIIGVGPSLIGGGPMLCDVGSLQQFFEAQGIHLVSMACDNYSSIFGGAVSGTYIVQTGFSTLADANNAAIAAIRAAGFDAQGHTNVPLASALPGYPDNTHLAPEDQYPNFLDGLAKQLGISTGTIEIIALALVGLLVVGVVIKKK